MKLKNNSRKNMAMTALIFYQQGSSGSSTGSSKILCCYPPKVSNHKGFGAFGSKGSSSSNFLEKKNKSILFTGDYLIWGEKVITRLQSGDTQAYNEIGKKYLERLPENLHVYPGHGKDYILDREGNWRNGL